MTNQRESVQVVRGHFNKGGPTMLRAPNFFLFFIALVLAVVGVMQYLGIPIKIPEIPGVAKIPEIPGVAQLTHLLANSQYSFWVLFSGWVLLALSSMFPRRRRLQ
ncbi:MAG: hypothetical protein ACLPKB_12820 [Xanthobacteraceae bacterium]